MVRRYAVCLLLLACSGTRDGSDAQVGLDSGSALLVCETPLVACAAQCVDTSSNDEHCGVCGNACTGGAVCTGSACDCPSGTELCNGVCADLTTDPGNCGSCGMTCQNGLVCEASECRCPATFTECPDGSCVDIDIDPEHCGACNRACSPLQSCVAGDCGCGDLDACPNLDVGYCSSELERFCCNPTEAFCDVDPNISWSGGCISDALSRTHLQTCGGTFQSCPEDGSPNCSTNGRLICCGPAFPFFCDEVPAEQWDGGCWSAEVQCNTITNCGGEVSACSAGTTVPNCSSTGSFFCCATDRKFCDARPAIGYDGGCWDPMVDCNSIRNCNGMFVGCTNGGTPDCQGSCV